MPAILLLLLSLLVSPKTPAKAPKFGITATPHYCAFSCDIRVNFTVPRHEDNRWLILSWSDVMVAGGHSGISQINLDGDLAPLYFERFLPALPEGVYNIAIQLFRKEQEQRSNYADVMVYVGVLPEAIPGGKK